MGNSKVIGEKMSCLILDVDLPAGVTIQKACKDAVELATRIGVTIKFEFNDKNVYAMPCNNIYSLIEAYHVAIKTNVNFVCTLDKDE